MKVIISGKYKKAEFEGQVYTPDMEDEYVGNVVGDMRKKRRNDIYPQLIPSAYKARHPSSVTVDREGYKGLGNLGREQGFVENPRNIQDILMKRRRRQKAIERDIRLDTDRKDFYNQLSQEEIGQIINDVEKYEESNPGKNISDSMINMLLKRRNQTNRGKIRKLKQLNKIVAYTIEDNNNYAIDDDVELELSEQEETQVLLDFLHFLESTIENFAKSRGIDPDSLRDFLTGKI